MNNELLNLLSHSNIIDLSHTLEGGMPVSSTHPHYAQNEIDSISKGDISYFNQIIMGEHCGTHVDAQNHFIKDGYSVAEMNLNQLIGRGLIIDIAHLPDNGIATIEIIQSWESNNYKIEKDDIIFFYTGHEKYWGIKPNFEKFLINWRGLSKQGAEYLRDIGVKAVGTDAMALDAFVNDGTHPAHQVLLSAGIPILENIANLKTINEPFTFIALPLKIKKGSASPLRAIAII